MRSIYTGNWFKCSVTLAFVLPFCIDGYAMTNCTVKGSLKHTESLTVICTKKGLRALPKDIPHDVRILDLSSNEMQRIKRRELERYRDLRHLNASKNQIQEVEDGAFKSVPALKELNLFSNRLTRLSKGVFRDLGNLTVLRLDGNIITTIEPSGLSLLTSLVILNLTGNHLHRIQAVQPLFTLSSVQELYMGRNEFSSFRSLEVSNTSTKLKVLDLSHNPLQFFQITTDVLPHLETLNLGFIKGSLKWDIKLKDSLRKVDELNLSGFGKRLKGTKSVLQSFYPSLTTLTLNHVGPKEVRQFINAACLIPPLRVLHLKFNNIVSLSKPMLQKCTGVTTLDLSHNSLKHFTRLAFRPMRSLTSLNLSHNKITNVPPALGKLTSLEFLDLSSNAISLLGRLEFANLTQLRILCLCENNIFILEYGVFNDLKHLEVLRLGGNKILSLAGIFEEGNLPKLRRLELQNNKLNMICRNELRGLVSLTHLLLRENQITKIEEGAFEGLRTLTHLDLQSNEISQPSLRPSVFFGLTQLRVLKLNNNYISYSCQKSLRDPPFLFLKSLQTLDISNQRHKMISELPSNFLEGLTSLQSFLANNNNLISLYPDIFINSSKLELLDISQNDLSSIAPEVFWPISKLRKLYVSRSDIRSVNFLVQANLTEICLLQMSKNKMSVINETVIRSLPKLTYLDMQGNAFSCDCGNAWFVNWAATNNDTQVVNAYTYKCNYPSKLRGKKLLHFDAESCNMDVGYFCFTSTMCLILLILLLSFFYQFLKLQVVYAYYLFLAFLYDSKLRRLQDSQGYLFDAFVSYSTHDELWVMKELLPQLEGEQRWKLCLHHRDFQAGKPIVDNIVDSIYRSRKTICVISRHYLRSNWCSKEVQVASFRLFDEKKDVLILVFLENIPDHQLSPYCRMRKLVKKHTYLSWPKLGQDTRVFWQKLKVALESGDSLNEGNAILSE
ncbi:toll-like receptor 13 [Chanos chanos]|uniref:Toll-like receptor 13 n=1 Tax=Chanos chanos TaxID=29144 RepID=A0A6J2VPA8_CHACN|nr:toll-like receptor 13 [Chanos chanos]